MVKHYIIWKLKEGLSDAEKEAVKAKAKTGLEALIGRIPGICSMTVRTDLLPSSVGDMMLLSEFEDRDALKAYQVNPLHVEVASFIRSVVSERACADFED